ncbi:hypothetical protein [Paracraurococcus ruber]|uniref:Uncharacterized protein n=1 Tax=Paracraurococcus ruber TaxID=77675 RepID=A0ABS1CVV5_9PROT|nr:hypothetical protein [Paracraurococcus ruber]MBK1658371.1 hypothetical protein [Paracraurococcus ruber]
MLALNRDQLAPPQRRGEVQQQQDAVARAGDAVAAGGDQAAAFGGADRGGAALRHAGAAGDAGQGVTVRRVRALPGLAGHATGAA